MARNVDTLHSNILTNQPDNRGIIQPDRPRRIGRRRRPSNLLIAVVAATTLIAGSSFVRLPYDTIGPGQALPVNDIVTISDRPTFKARGQILSTTVSVSLSSNPSRVIGAWLDPDVDVLPREQITGGIPETRFQEASQEAMVDSKTAARVVALRYLGFGDLTDGAEIVTTYREFPAASQLRVGDVVTAADGKPVRSSSALVEAIQNHRSGDVLTLLVARGEEAPQPMHVSLGTDARGQVRLGVRLTSRVSLPFKIRISSGSVSGPSAGLAYGLEILDLLTPGELTGGAKVAVTGELTFDGQVGAVGGIRQKTIGVQRAGATLFLVPKGNEAEARAAAKTGLRVVGVSDFASAVTALASLPKTATP